jgi:hypothetical protein
VTAGLSYATGRLFFSIILALVGAAGVVSRRDQWFSPDVGCKGRWIAGFNPLRASSL